jgi:S1-C subfamily serine protease
LKSGDIIMAVDGQSIDDPDSFGYRFATKAIGSVTSMTVSRGGKTLTLPLKLSTAPEVPARETIKLKNNSPFSGATIVNFSPAVGEEMSLQGVHEGVVVADIEAGSSAAEAGLEKGDVILGLEGERITSTKQLQRVTAADRSYYRLTLGRGGQVVQTEIGG